MHKLTLGTAQLGMDYGISNKTGKMPISESLSILNYAYNQDIRSFDTALAYGNSESVIGTWIRNTTLSDIVITSKIPSLKKRDIQYSQLEKEIRSCLERSLNNLNVNKLNHYLIHDFNDVRYYDEKIFSVLDMLKDEGLIGSYGCSIYDLEELEYLDDRNIGIVQIPGSVFNQRILCSSELSKLRNKGTTVHVRTAFIQGLVFMEDKEIPEMLSGIRVHLQKLRKMIQDSGITISEAALNYVRNHPNTDSIVFGVQSIDQIKELLAIDENNQLNAHEINKAFSDIPLKLIDPRHWR